jgi:hypothetical protein
LELLREVLDRHAPQLLELLPRAAANTLERSERLRLCEVIAAEFATSGIGSDSEPLPRGLKLEELLDVLNRANLA